jgi:hypothetical protein
MADYIAILDTQLDPDAPITSALAYQWRDNPLAVIEGATGAPKVRLKTQYSATLSGAIVFSGLGEWDGFTVNIHASQNTGSAEDVDIEFSDNGSTWYGIDTVATVTSGGGGCHVYLSCDFATMKLVGSAISSNAASGIDHTITGGSSSITHVRISYAGNEGAYATLHANGGQTTV